MSKKKATKKYYFSVEGETEQWYLKWLQDTINNTEQAVYRVSIDCPVRKDPVKHAKCLNVTQKVEVYHFFDYESDEQTHVNAFMSAMDNMKKAEKIGKQITYKSGYSNFTFDLWIVLHMADSNASYAIENSISCRLTVHLVKSLRAWRNIRKRKILSTA